MSEGSGGARAEMERRIVQRSIEDEAFRQRLEPGGGRTSPLLPLLKTF